jgi:hypothetical protein
MREPNDQKKNPEQVELDGVSEGIEALPQRVDRYSKARKGALDVAEYMQGLPGQQGKAVSQRVTACGDYLLFRHFFTVDKVKLHAAQFCKAHLLCPLCAIRRGAKALAAYLQRWEAIRLQRPTLRPFLVTLTVKDGPDLAERFNHLHKAQRELWKRKHRIYESALDGVEGAVWSYEVKRGQGSGQWHPHLHMIALAEVEPDAETLSREWHEITGDSFIVDVRPISQEDPVSGFIEVFKYAVKFSDQEPADTVHAWSTLKGKRLLASSGCFRGVDVPDDLADDASDVAGLPFMDMLYRYSRRGGYSLAQVTPGTASDRPFKAHSKAKAPTTPSYLAADLVAALRTRQTLDRGYGGSPPCQPSPGQRSP